MLEEADEGFELQEGKKKKKVLKTHLSLCSITENSMGGNSLSEKCENSFL